MVCLLRVSKWRPVGRVSAAHSGGRRLNHTTQHDTETTLTSSYILKEVYGIKSSNMDYPQEVQEKLNHLRSYVPFVERMISKLEVRSQQIGTSPGQLDRLHGLHGFLTKPLPRAPRMEMLEKMEAVIRSMHEKVQKAQGKPVAGSSPTLEVNSSGPEPSHSRPEPSYTGPELSYSPPELNRSEPETSYSGIRTGYSGTAPKPSSLTGHGFAHGTGVHAGVGQPSPGHGMNPVHTHRPSPVHNPASGERKSTRESGGGEKPRELGREERAKDRGGMDVSREGSYERGRGRDFDRGEARHVDRNRERGNEKSREREYERSRSKDYERRRSHDLDRHRGMERSAERDARIRTLNEREYERNRERGGSFRERDHERERNRDGVRGSSSQERQCDRSREREAPRMERQHSLGEHERRQLEGKMSSKRNSLLDLPMPPSATSRDIPHPFGDIGNIAEPNTEKFQNSREKLQKLFGIFGDSSGPREEASTSITSRSRGWRDEVRARGDQFFTGRSSSQATNEVVDDRGDYHLQRRRSQHDDNSSKPSHHPNAMRDYSRGLNSDPRNQSHHWKVSSSHSSTTHHVPPQRESQQSTPCDTPMSPDQSPSCGFEAVDTPQSPDMEASFSPIVSSEEGTPVKTIPLENLQQKGVDLEAIKKALAQIRANEKPQSNTSSSEQGPSYRYEDFVGPAIKAKADEDEPYDPEEVWNCQDLEMTERQHPAVSMAHSSTGLCKKDVDLRQIPKSIPLPHIYQAKMQERQSHYSGHQVPHIKDAARTSDTGSSAPVSLSNIPLPQRQTTAGQICDKSLGHIPHSQSTTSGAGWFQASSTTRPNDSQSIRENVSDVDMRHHQHQPPLPKSHHPPLPKVHQPPLPKPHQPPLPASHQPALPKSNRPSSPATLQASLSKSHQPPLPKSHQSSLVKSHQSPLPKSFQPPLPKSPPPEPHLSPSPSNKRPDELTDKEGHRYMVNRLDNIRSRIAHQAGELIKPGQQGVALTQMEKYKLKRQTSLSEVKSPTHSLGMTSAKENVSVKSESSIKGKDSLSVLDLLIPESEKGVEEKPSVLRDPRQVNQNVSTQPPRDPRLKQQVDPPENDSVSVISRSRDPRLSTTSTGGGLPSLRDPRHQSNRDPRQESGSFSTTLIRDGRDDAGKFYVASNSANRDPRQDPGKFPSASGPQVRDPRHEAGAYIGVSGTPARDPRHELGNFSGIPARGSRDPRQEAGIYPTMTGSQYRDPRMTSRVERPSGSVWQPQPAAALPGNYPVQQPPSSSVGVVDPNPAQSASGSLIGQTFTCLMMRGLPPFTNSNHIYHFFQEYILRDISIELDSHYLCKGTAYIHFPSHASAREALELVNGHHLQGYPITLRICTVGILRQAKNAYEQLNRDREAQLGIPERPRGNGNPFFKPRPKEQPSKPVPSKSASLTASVETPASSKKVQEPEEVVSEVGGNTNKYSELCGVKVPPKSSGKILSFKIPKIRKEKDAARKNAHKAVTIDESKNKTKTSEKKKVTHKPTEASSSKVKPPVKDSSESDDDLRNIKATNKKNRKFKKIVILSDSDSEDEEKPNKSNSSKYESLSSVSDKMDMSNDDDDDDDDEGYMVIDETVMSDDGETEESEVSSQVSEEPLDQALPVKVKEKRKPKDKKKSKSSTGKGTKKRAPGSTKGKKKVPIKTDTSARKIRGKKSSDKYMADSVYKPELNLNSSVGLKLTRHTQGELEELITEKKKLKVLIPAPHKLVVTLSDDDKLKRRGGRRKVTEILPPPIVEEVKVISETPPSVVPENIVPVVSSISRQKLNKSVTEDVVIVKKEVIVKSWVQAKDSISDDEMFLPVNTKLNCALKREVAIGTPTSRKGKKRKLSATKNEQIKTSNKESFSNSSLNDDDIGGSTDDGGEDTSNSREITKHGVTAKGKVSKKFCLDDEASSIKSEGEILHIDSSNNKIEDTSKNSRETAKRGLTTPIRGTVSKKSRIDVEDSSFKSDGENSHQFDVFENDGLSDDMPDLTQITPSLLDVDPTISNALPNASALANVLSPPHMIHQVNENVAPSRNESSGDWSCGKLQIMEVESLPSEGVSLTQTKEDDKVLDEMLDMVIESRENRGKTEVDLTEKTSVPDTGKETPQDALDIKLKEKLESTVEGKIILKESDGNTKATLDITPMEGVLEKSKDLDNEKKVGVTASLTRRASHPDSKDSDEDVRHKGKTMLANTEGESKDINSTKRKLSTSVDVHTSEAKGLPNNDSKGLETRFNIEAEATGISFNTSDQNKKLSHISFERSAETKETKVSSVGLEVSIKTDGNTADSTMNSEDMDMDDDAASVGKVSTSSFVDDASIVSSEGRDLKTPESQSSKKGKRSKSIGSLASIECRRVTRGSVVQPLTAEVVEWDDGGVVDLFQCDLCDYFGRHMANHLVNFHTERELLCEFKKEDFPPVIKDHVGPPKEMNKDDHVPIDLSWIPTHMNFEKSVTCKDCDYISNSRFDLIYHFLEHTPEMAAFVFHCRLCNYMSEKKEDFYNHISSHTGEYRYRCELCGHRTYKMALLQAHHKECHRTQSEKFFISAMIEEDGWLYINVCKICMFVRIGLTAAEEHVKHRHGGKADIHKANMSRHIVLHSELRKASGESENTSAPRPKYKGKKKKRGKRGPDLEVFVGEEKEDETGEEEKAKQLVDRISLNIHTTISAQEAHKRMTLLNSISKKLDEEAQEEEKEGELGVKPKNQEELPASCQLSTSANKSDVIKEGKKEIQSESTNTEQKSDEPQNVLIDDSNDGKNAIGDVQKNATNEDTDSVESDSESTMSAVEHDAMDDAVVGAGKGFLQDTIKKLSAKLEEDAKKTKFEITAVEQKQEEEKPQQESQEVSAGDKCVSASNVHDDDSDSDNLVICEDVDTDAREDQTPADDSQAGASSVDTSTGTGGTDGPSLHDSIQSILREASAKNQAPSKMPKLRIRPAHQLLDPRHTIKPPKRKIRSACFTCCDEGCSYSSINNMDLIKHIIVTHGPYKCIASGCQFVTKSREVFSIHFRTLHPKLSFLVCPFHCKNVFRHFDELVEHLSSHNTAHEEDLTTQSEEESEVPGFLRIESVSTLDPTAASQMFGEDYDGTSSESVSSSSQVKSPVPTTSDEQGVAGIMPVISVVKTGNTFVSTAINSSVIESQASFPVPGVTLSGTNMLQVAITTPVSIPPVTGTSLTKTTTSMLGNTDASSEAIGGTCTQSPLEAVSSSSQAAEAKKSQPAVVTLDEDGGGEKAEISKSRSEHPPPPGMSTLPRVPPTVPVPSVFQIFQPIDIFKTLITKLAPEVFKCMYKGCIYADDDPELFVQHISLHGQDYRCCYCLVLMASPGTLVQHVITEHSHCQFQCKYCLYRAFTKVYMGVHLKNFHPYEEPRYIKVGTIQSDPPPNPSIDQFVRPYRCNYQECQYRTVDAEAFKTHVNAHGPFVILSCDFCHKHLHVIPLIDHMREHQMNEYQCPYCLHGDAEKERLLSHLLNCHPGRPGKVLLRKQITSSVSGAVGGTQDFASPPPTLPQPPPDAAIKRLNSYPDNRSAEKKTEERISSTLPATGKEGPQTALNIEGRRMSRSLSRELDSKLQDSGINFNLDEDGSSNSRSQSMGADDSSSPQTAEKTDLSGHALYRCGNESCEYSSICQIQLREHLQVCDLAQDSTILKCYHCGKQCRHLSTLFDHLRVHGPKRYYCGVTGCDYRATMVHYFKNHMKQIHRCSGFKQLLKDPKNRDPETQEYVVYPKDAVPPMREGHRKRKNEYSIEDIHRIPRVHISYHDLKCYHCQFTTKVRLNLVKHIKLHEKHPDGIPERLYITGGNSTPIPMKQPINPVPCLDRKELMFDKMMNLAGSSFEYKKKKEDTDFRAKNPIPHEEYLKLPKFVAEERLYSCGIEGCNYLSCDDMMLKYHIRTLHADIASFPCPHCTELSITVEKMSSHFKLHGERLFRCGWCSYISCRRNVVERHMKDKHPTKKPFDFVIREPDDPDAPKKMEEQTSEHESVPPVPPPVLQDPQWQCGLCKFSSVTQQEMVNHTSLKHAIKSQFKCGYCSVRSSVRTSFDAHFAAKHPSQPFRVLCMYYRLDSEDIEPLHQGGTQHTHEPLWKRNDPERIRHIRGILIEDDPETKKTWLKQTGIGKPDKEEFVCPRCGSFKTSCISTFRSHLCREADYDRYQCVECGVCNALLPSLQRHYTKTHHAPFTNESYLNLPVEDEKEGWVENVISRQQQLIKQWREKGCVETVSEPASSQSGALTPQHASPAKTAAATRRSLSNLAPSGEGSPQQGGVVLHDSGSERGRFVCDTCGCECRSAAGLKSHTTAMHQARFKCHYCPFASNSEDAVKQHSSVKHPKLQNEVLDVSQRCKVQKADDTQPNNAALEEIDVCENDSPVSPLKDETLQGTKIKSEVKSGSEIGEGIVEGALSVEESPEVMKVCPYCSFTTNSSSRLNQHKRNKHANTRLFMCSYCNGRFNTKMDALRHHKWKHQQLKPDITHLEADEALLKVEGEINNKGNSNESSLPLLPVGSRLPKLAPGPKPMRNKARKSFTKPLLSSASRQVQESSTSALSNINTSYTLPVASSESEVSYSCCHCNQRSNKVVMDEHIKKQHRDLPYQVRKEEGDKIFTEVHIYKCVHCIAESISLAQAMDHWIQNHPLLDFKFKMVLRHSGEVSNQVVSSTTADKEPLETPSEMDTSGTLTLDTDVSTTDSGINAATSSAIASSTVITSSSENPNKKPLVISKRRGSGKDMKSPNRYSIDTEEEEQIEVTEAVEDEGETLVQSSSETECEDLIYKCGLCKKSSEKLEELQAHMSKIHADRAVKVKKIRREVFEQLYRAEYECCHCGERARHHPIQRHHKSAHPNLPLKITRLPSAPRENIYFRCDVCGHVVKNLQSIRQHIRRHHPEADEFTFSKLTLGSPMRPPMKHPFKCNYCGDVGETVQEMQTHHAFLHSHLECSITNLMDEALSSVHSPSTSHSSGEPKPPVFAPMPAVCKSSPAQSGELSNPQIPTAAPIVPMPKHKNTARKSIPTLVKHAVAKMSTSKLQRSVVTNISGGGDDNNDDNDSDDNEPFSSYCVPQPPLELENIYAFVNLGAGVPMRLTVQQLRRLIKLSPQVTVTNIKSVMKIT
ncbi:uncharacterized protein LOC121854154 isoform X2 [Homarus americanus]|nr:uncharacterized protein LOC121854154 isoform X2 [Homarus americanus]